MAWLAAPKIADAMPNCCMEFNPGVGVLNDGVKLRFGASVKLGSVNKLGFCWMLEVKLMFGLNMDNAPNHKRRILLCFLSTVTYAPSATSIVMFTIVNGSGSS